MNGINVACIKGLDNMVEGKEYTMVTIGGCYAFYEGDNMIGTIHGRSSFSEHFKIRNKRSPRKTLSKRLPW